MLLVNFCSIQIINLGKILNFPDNILSKSVSGAVQFVLCLKDTAYENFCRTILTTSCSSIIKLFPFFRVQNQDSSSYKKEVVKIFF